MRGIVCILILWGLSTSQIMSQQKIGVFYSGNGPFENYVAEIDLESCAHEVLFAFSHSLGFSDLLYAPDGYFYGTSGEGSFLVRMDANDGSYIDSWAIPHPVFTTNVYAALAVKEDGVIIIGGRHGSLAEFDIYTDEITWLGYLEDQNPNGIVISGLTYFNERLFAIAPGGVVAEIFKENMTVEMILETSGSQAQSLTYLESQCGEPILISGLGNGGLRYIYPDRDSFYNSCSVETSNRAIFGLTSYTEYQASPACRDTIDLNGLTAGFDHFGEDVCGIGRAHIAHDSVEVYGEFAMDSIGVAVVEDPDIGAGTIEVGNVGGITVDGASTGEVLAYGMVDFAEWEVWLRTVEYVSTSTDPAPGLRRIAVVGYFNGGETTDTAWAEIEVFRPEFSAGVGVEIEECPTGNLVDLFDYLSEADEGGRWEPALSDGMLDLIPSNSGIYSYIVDHPECGSDTALVDLFVWPGPDIVIEGGGEWCTGDAAELEVMGDLSKVVSYLWNTGEIVPSIEVNESGTYWVQLGYGEDCIWTDTLEVQFTDLPEIGEEAALCPGESMVWQGQTIEAAGEYETILSGEGGECDTLLLLTVAESDWITRETEVEICPGGEYEIRGEVLTEAGQYEFVLPADEGCDTLLNLQLIWSDYPERVREISLCPGEAYEFQGEVLTEAGDYDFVLPSTSTGSDTLLQIQIAEAVLPESEILGPDRVCEGESIELRASPPEELEQVFWNTGQSSTIIQVYESGLYSFEAKTAADCRVYAEKWIGDCPSRKIYIPNAFSPNYDGINDLWEIYSKSTLEWAEVKIFNRWGGKVYEAQSGEISWDGKMDGEEMPQGVYLYTLWVEYEDGYRERLSGEFLLMR
jgi:gliding motility-associated-like protein